MRGTDHLRYQSSPEAEARVLLLINGFTHRRDGNLRQLEGRVKLAKLDFLLRYPQHLTRVLRRRKVSEKQLAQLLDIADTAPIDSRMMRYRYGPWDPSYYAILGSLIGRDLIIPLPAANRGNIGYRCTERGTQLATALASDESFVEIGRRISTLRTHLDLSGAMLTKLIYELPEVTNAAWEEDIV